MFALGLDTTSSALTLGITDFDALVQYQTWDLGRDISLYLHQYLATFLEPLCWSDLQWLVVAQGPGSFTGTRIGVVTTRMLAQQLQIPLYGISRLTAQAYAYASATASINSGDLIAVEIPGQRDSVYGGLFTWDDQTRALTTFRPIQCLALEAWQQILSSETIQHSVIPSSSTHEQICRAMIALAHQEWRAGKYSSWQDILPYYGSLAARPKVSGLSNQDFN